MAEDPKNIVEQPTTTLEEKVEQRLRAAQEKKLFKDTEARVGGSKKERMAYKLIVMSDLDAIEKDALTAIELVKKDKVYPRVDAFKEREAGVSAGAAFLKTKMRESFSNNPPNNSHKRKAYVGYVNYLVAAFTPVVSVTEFEEKVGKLIDEGLEKIIEILRPELIPQIEEERAKSKVLIEEAKKAHNEMEELAEEQKNYLIQTYPHLKSFHGGLNMGDIPESDVAKQKYFEYKNKSSELRSEFLQLSNSEFTSIAKGFLETMGLSSRYSSLWSVTHQIFEEVFGKRFVNFIRKNSEAVRETYVTARDYEALSEDESQKLLEQKNKHNVESLQKTKDDIAEAESLVTREEFDAFFTTGSRGNVGFSGGDFFHWQKRGLKYFYYKDCTTPQMIEAYRKRWLEDRKKSIGSTERRIAQIKEQYRARANNWDWAFNKKAADSKAKSELVINRGVPLQYIKRTGGIKITDEDVTVESIREKFGFKQVEFGQTLKDTEAREHIRHFLGAMADWGDIMNMDVIQINQRGGLSMAFASRGAGKAMAHFEPLRKIINITKSRGDGTVAHEYTHYIDNLLRMLDGTAGVDNMSKLGWSATALIPTRSSYGYYKQKVLNNEAVNTALQNIFNYIFKREKPGGIKPEDKVFVKETIDASDKQFRFPSYIKGENIEDYFKSFVEVYTQYRFFENLKKRDYEILGAIVSRFGFKSYEFTFQSRTTAFYSNSSKMSSDYWTREWELFARASETYIEDKLTKAGRANNYLVGGNYESESWQGVYPVGQERADLFELYDALFKAIKEEYHIGDFKAWTTERTDEYIELKDEKEEAPQAGVVVEEGTGDVVEVVGDSSSIKEKMQRLIEILKSAKMERGGIISQNKYTRTYASDLLIKFLNV